MTDHDVLRVRLALHLTDQDPLDARTIAEGLGTSKTEVNTLLYGDQPFFLNLGGTPPLWTIDTGVATPFAALYWRVRQALAVRDGDSLPASASTQDQTGLPTLHTWQEEALDAWRANGRCGIVEAVTGAGKTRVALAAIEESVRGGAKAAVIVPTVELQRQWLVQLESTMPGPKCPRSIHRLAGD